MCALRFAHPFVRNERPLATTTRAVELTRQDLHPRSKALLVCFINVLTRLRVSECKVLFLPLLEQPPAPSIMLTVEWACSLRVLERNSGARSPFHFHSGAPVFNPLGSKWNISFPEWSSCVASAPFSLLLHYRMLHLRRHATLLQCVFSPSPSFSPLRFHACELKSLKILVIFIYSENKHKLSDKFSWDGELV